MQAGVNVAEIAELHGTSIKMIDRTYGHLNKHVAKIGPCLTAV